MQDFVHLHVHTQYSILDGQASIPRLVDKAIADGMKGIAVTDHGDMFGIKEFFNYVNKKNGKTNGEIKDLKKKIAGLEKGKIECENPEEELIACKEQLEAAKKKLFKPIFGCEMYVARRRLFNKEGKPDQSGYHLVVLAKNEKGYHNLIKLVSKAWTEGFYMRPRTDRVELEKYHEGLIVCSACLAGEVPRKILQGKVEEAEEAIQWYKNLFGSDFYLELQRHKATVARANHEAYDLQRVANEKAKDAEIERLLALVNQQAMDTNKSKAMASTSEIKTLLGLKDNDADYDDFLSNIVSDNAEKTSKIATYVNKIVKDSYEKGKKDAMKDGLGNMGKGGKSSTGNPDVGALGKELAQKNIVNKSDFDYFKECVKAYEGDVLALAYIVGDAGLFLCLQFGCQVNQLHNLVRGEVQQFQKMLLT